MINLTALKKVWGLLTRKQRRAAIVLLGLMLVGMVLETLGVALVIPALALMSQSDLAVKYPMLLPWLNWLGNPTHEWLVIFGMLSLVGVYAIKAFFLGFLAWRQVKFVYGVQADLSQKLFMGYLSQPYTFHLKRNSAQLIRNVVSEVNVFTQTGLMYGMLLITELLVLIGISILLITVEPLGALVVVCILGLAGWLFSRITRKYIHRWGEARQYHEGLRLQYLQEGLGGVKDVKLLGREKDFLEQYQSHNVGSARVAHRQATLQALPRLWLELLAISGLAMLVIIMINQGKALDALLPSIGLFAVAAFRLMPSVNRVLNAIQGIGFALPVINTLNNEVKLINNPLSKQSSQTLNFNNELTLDKVSFQYETSNSPSLHSVSLSITAGTSVGLIGSSGAGKSTIVDIILGLLTPVSGTVNIDGVDIQTRIRDWQNQIGYVPQSIFLTDDTLRRNIAFGLPHDQINDTAVWNAIHSAQLEQFVKDLPEGLNTLVGERGVRLSGGQRQRIGIARALYHNPAVLVLDEATSSLDTDTEKGVMDAVQALRGSKTIIIVAHRLSTVEHCDHLFRFEQGRIVEEGNVSMVLGVSD